MGKVTNITPEEREQAIYTIGKLGEEITDERIEYYVQLRRNTIQHQEEKQIKEDLNDVSEQTKEFAKKVLSYLRRSKSERQILLYAKKHTETLSYIKKHNMDVDYTPSLLGEAIRVMEGKLSTTIHHLTGEDLAICLKDRMGELINRRNMVDNKNKGKIDEKKMEEFADTDEVKKSIRLAKIAFWLGVILILAPFFITGFGFGWFWYIVILGVTFFTFILLGFDGKSKGDYSYAKTLLIAFCIVGCVMYLWGPLNPKYTSGSVRSTNFSEMKSIIKESGTITEDEAKYLVVNYILNHMKDPNSYEPVSWGPLKKTQEIDGEGGGWNIKHKFRGTNSYGGVVTEEHYYLIHKDGWVTTF